MTNVEKYFQRWRLLQISNLTTYSKENQPTKTASAISKKYSSSEQKIVQYYLFWLQLKALFMNLVYFHGRALSSQPTPYQVLKLKYQNIKNYKKSIVDNSTKDCRFLGFTFTFLHFVQNSCSRSLVLCLYFVFCLCLFHLKINSLGLLLQLFCFFGGFPPTKKQNNLVSWSCSDFFVSSLFASVPLYWNKT